MGNLMHSSVILLSILAFLSPQTTLAIHFDTPIQSQSTIAHSTCQDTLYPQLCVSTLSTFPDLHLKSLPEIISGNVHHTLREVAAAASNCTGLGHNLPRLDPIDIRALDLCLELFDETTSVLRTVISVLSTNLTSEAKQYNDLQTLLSAAMTNQDTCLDGFAYGDKKVRHLIADRVNNISHHVSNSLAMLKKVIKKSPSEEEVFPEYGKLEDDGFPEWLSPEDRRLLESPVSETKFNLVVSQDGNGDFKTIGDAVRAAPNSSNTRFVIYIKAGAYFEYLELDKKKRNLMFVGDGIGNTWIKGDRNYIDGWSTYKSATVAVGGSNFVAKGISFENYAGPSKHQAVAVRISADLAAFYKCSFVGYQDTLYSHSYRQFFRECDVYGTIDFIFGNAAVVFQLCNLYARKPNENQKNLFTAQGRTDPNQNTGISVMNSKVVASSDLLPVQSKFKTYLGRPWKEYSRTVFLFCYMSEVVDPKGWLEWSGEFALKTLYYGEYKNRGPGSNTSQRVTWPGYRVINSSTEASQFTVQNFIMGDEWLTSTGIPFYPDLTPPDLLQLPSYGKLPSFPRDNAYF